MVVEDLSLVMRVPQIMQQIHNFHWETDKVIFSRARHLDNGPAPYIVQLKLEH